MSAAASKQAFRQWLGEDLLFLRLPAALLGLRLGALREKLKHKYTLPFSGFAAVTRSAGLQSAVWTYKHLHPQTRHNPWKFRGLV